MYAGGKCLQHWKRLELDSEAQSSTGRNAQYFWQDLFLAIQGPNATKILQPLTEMDILNLKIITLCKRQICRCGQCADQRYRIYPVQVVLRVENKDGDADKNGTPFLPRVCTRNKTCRFGRTGYTSSLEMGFCLYGNDIDDTTSPLEAGLGWITKFTKDFTARKKSSPNKSRRRGEKLVGFEMVEKIIPVMDMK